MTFTLRPIRDLGYDETEKGKHIDLHGEVDINKIKLNSKKAYDRSIEFNLILLIST